MLTIFMTDRTANVIDNNTQMVLSYIKLSDNDTIQSVKNKLTIEFMKNVVEGKSKFLCDISQIIEQIADAKIIVK